MAYYRTIVVLYFLAQVLSHRGKINITCSFPASDKEPCRRKATTRSYARAAAAAALRGCLVTKCACSMHGVEKDGE